VTTGHSPLRTNAASLRGVRTAPPVSVIAHSTTHRSPSGWPVRTPDPIVYVATPLVIVADAAEIRTTPLASYTDTVADAGTTSAPYRYTGARSVCDTPRTIMSGTAKRTVWRVSAIRPQSRR
jgi:hypothetical protein